MTRLRSRETPRRMSFDGEAEGKQAGVFHFQAVVEDGDPARTTPLRVVGVDDGVHDGLPECCRREGPAIDPAHRSDHRLPGDVAAHKGDGLLDGRHRQALDLGTVENPAPVGPLEAPGLNPGVGEVAFPIPAEEQDPADRGHIVALVWGQEPEGAQVAPAQSAHRCEQLGSSSEVHHFGVDIRQRLFVIGLVPGRSAELADHDQ